MKTLNDFDFNKKRVLLRVDFNVPLENGQIMDDFRIKAELPTIKYLLDQSAKIILLTHLGRPEGQIKSELKVDPVAKRLEELLGRPVFKLNDCIGKSVEEKIADLKSGEIILLENVQFHQGEKENDPKYAKALAKLADVFVFDAFGQSHRNYASVSGVSRLLPSCAGLVFQKEIEVLGKALKNPARPLVAVIGGAKISTKIKLISNFIKIADHVNLGGALANTVIQANGFAIGKSLTEEDMIVEVKKFKLTDTKLHIPVDIVVSTDTSGKAPIRIAPVGNTKADELILDVGPDTIYLFSNIIKSAGTIIWNGPMGVFEVNQFAQGTREIAQAIALSDGFSIVGGGETIALLEEMDLGDKIDHVSTGGGAMLDFLSGQKLPALEALN